MIPGAWHGAWAWHPVAERLRAAGHHTVALTLPGMADGDNPVGLRLQDSVDYVVSQVKKLGLSNVTLVAHSWGGFPMTGAAARLTKTVSKVIYVSAYVPMPNGSLVDENTPEQRAGIIQSIEATPDHTDRPSLGLVQGLLMQDAAPEAQSLLAGLLVSQPGDYFLDRLYSPNVTKLGIPAQYILAEHDMALPRPGAEFAKRLGLTPVMVPGTHECVVTHPDEVANAILAG